MTLEEILALFPDNTTGEIDAEDMRTAITELWNYTRHLQADQHEVIVTLIPALDARLTALEARVTALEQA